MRLFPFYPFPTYGSDLGGDFSNFATFYYYLFYFILIIFFKKYSTIFFLGLRSDYKQPSSKIQISNQVQFFWEKKGLNFIQIKLGSPSGILTYNQLVNKLLTAEPHKQFNCDGVLEGIKAWVEVYISALYLMSPSIKPVSRIAN